MSSTVSRERCIELYIMYINYIYTVFDTALLESTVNKVKSVLEPLGLWDISTFGIVPSEEEID